MTDHEDDLSDQGSIKPDPVITFDTTEYQINDLKVDEEVTITIKGKIKELSMPNKGEGGVDRFKFPGHITILRKDLKIEGVNVFTELDKEDDE